MGTNNFGKLRASKSFEVLMPTTIPYKECEHCSQRVYEYECDFENLVECENGCENPTFTEGEEDGIKGDYVDSQDFKEAIKEALSNLTYGIRDSNRGKDEIGLYKLTEYKNYGDIEVGVEIDCFVEVGYYEGGRLDFSIQFEVNGSEIDEEDINLSEIQSEFDYSSDLPKGMQTILSKKALIWLGKTKEEMITKIEEVYGNFA